MQTELRMLLIHALNSLFVQRTTVGEGIKDDFECLIREMGWGRGCTQPDGNCVIASAETFAQVMYEITLLQNPSGAPNAVLCATCSVVSHMQC